MENTFNTLKLNPLLIEGLKKQQIEQPTDIQTQVIPLALENKDVIGQSQTGSGKTLAYLLPLFEKIDSTKREMQAIILTPTIELAMQVEAQIKLLATNSTLPITSTNIVGQVNIKRQVEKLRDKPHIIVGSTGRILELIKMKKINAQTVKTIIMDEGDRLLDKNNLDVVKDIIKTTQKDRQLMMFTATLNMSSIEIATELMNDPKIIQVSTKQRVSESIIHQYIVVDHYREKIEMLRKVVSSINPDKALVFLNKSDLIQTATDKLQYHHYDAFALFGTATKLERQNALQGFRNGKIKILIASDLAARGLDIEGLTHIFNMDLPQHPNEYLHRVGRTGRMGKEGTAISIVTKQEISYIKKYERDLKISIQEIKIYKGIIEEVKSK